MPMGDSLSPAHRLRKHTTHSASTPSVKNRGNEKKKKQKQVQWQKQKTTYEYKGERGK
jgi:hypothetical protein